MIKQNGTCVLRKVEQRS